MDRSQDITADSAALSDADGQPSPSPSRGRKPLYKRALRKVYKSITSPEKDSEGHRLSLAQSISRRLSTREGSVASSSASFLHRSPPSGPFEPEGSGAQSVPLPKDGPYSGLVPKSTSALPEPQSMTSGAYAVALAASASASLSNPRSPSQAYAVPAPSTVTGVLTYSASEPLAPADRVSLQLSSVPDEPTSKASLLTPTSQASHTKLASPTQPDDPQEGAGTVEPEHTSMPTVNTTLSAAALVPASKAEDTVPEVKPHPISVPQPETRAETQLEAGQQDADAEQAVSSSPVSSPAQEEDQEQQSPDKTKETVEAHHVTVQDPFVESRRRHVFTSPSKPTGTDAAGGSVAATAAVPPPPLASLDDSVDSRTSDAPAPGAAVAIAESLNPEASPDTEKADPQPGGRRRRGVARTAVLLTAATAAVAAGARRMRR